MHTISRLTFEENVTSAQREYADIDEDVDESSSNITHYPSMIGPSNDMVELSDGKCSSSKTKSNNRMVINEKVEKPINFGDQQEDWEDYEEPMNKLEELRLKLTGNHGDRSADDDEDEFFENQFENTRENPFNGENNEKFIRPKEKSVWKVEQVAGAIKTDVVDTSENNEHVHRLSNQTIEEQESMNSGVYRAPHLRSTKTSLTIISGHNQKKTKKDKPNFASTEEFPTLGAGHSKKS